MIDSLLIRSATAAGLAAIVLALAGVARADDSADPANPAGPLGAAVWWSVGPEDIRACNARVVRFDPRDGYAAVCELHIVGPCAMTLAQCLNSSAYVAESEEPADTLGCEAKPRPRVLVVDCIDVDGTSGESVL